MPLVIFTFGETKLILESSVELSFTYATLLEKLYITSMTHSNHQSTLKSHLSSTLCDIATAHHTNKTIASKGLT